MAETGWLYRFGITQDEWLARQVRFYTGGVAVSGQRTAESSQYMWGIFVEHAAYVAGV